MWAKRKPIVIFAVVTSVISFCILWAHLILLFQESHWGLISQHCVLCYQVKTFSFSSSRRNIYNLSTSCSISQSFRPGPLKPYQKWSDSPPRASFHLWTIFKGLIEFFKHYWVFKISRDHHVEYWNPGCQLKCKAPASCVTEIGYHHLLLELCLDGSPLPHGLRMMHRHMAACSMQEGHCFIKRSLPATCKCILLVFSLRKDVKWISSYKCTFLNPDMSHTIPFHSI